MIDEKKLIEEINRIIFEADIHKSYVQEVFKDILDTIKNQTNIGEWIPVSERLPGDREDKLVWLSSGRMTIASHNEHRLPFNNEPIGWGHGVNYPFNFTTEKVIAWMPLPEPYKEREADDD